MRLQVSRITTTVGWPALAIAGWLPAAGIAACGRSDPRQPAAEVAYRFPIDLPDSVEVANNVGVKLALSRDGSQLVVAGMKAGRRSLFLRRSDDIEARPLAGTDSGHSPSFSPDGQWILFQSGTRLWKVRTSGGEPQRVLDSASAASWGDDGAIVYEKGNALWRIPVEGGEPRRVAAPDGAERHRRYSWPEVLPGSRHALITLWRGSNSLDSARLGVVALGDGRVTDLGIRGANPHYAEPGYIVFARVGGSVAAVPFSLRRLAITDSAVQLLQNVWTGGGGGTDFAVSSNGVLAYHGGIAEAEEMSMVAVDLRGNTRPLAQMGRQRFGEPRISPDGRHLAVAIGPPPPSDTSEVWVYDLATGARTRVSAEGVAMRPEWTRDGSRVVYVSRQRDSQFVVSRPRDGSGSPEVMARGRNNAFYELSIGPVHGSSAIRTGLAPGGSAILVAPTDSLAASRPFDTGARVSVTPRVSPDGKLLAFVATDSGRRELFVRRIDGEGPRIRISTDGGTEPVWSPDGTTLYFRGLTHLMSATVTQRPALSASAPVALFPDSYHRSVAHTGYDVFPDGRELLMLGGWSRAQSRVYLLVNWTRTMAPKRAAR